MSAYLEHRLAHAGVGTPQAVCIATSRDSWVFADIADDLTWTYPGVRVFAPAEAPEACTLAIVPFLGGEHPRSRRHPALAAALRTTPDHVGFFEMRKRRLVVVPRRSVSGYLVRAAAERLLGLAMDLPGRIVRGGGRRLRALLGAGDEAR
jgi:hypothetical protein